MRVRGNAFSRSLERPEKQVSFFRSNNLITILDFLITILVVGSVWFTMMTDAMWAPWFFVTLFTSIIFVHKLWNERRVPKVPLLLFSYVMISGICMFEFRPMTDGGTVPEMSALRLLSAHATLEFVFLGTLFLFFWNQIRIPMAVAFVYVGLAHAFYLMTDLYSPIKIQGNFLYNMDTKGLLGNKSIGATFLTVWIFFALHYLKKPIEGWLRWALGFATIAMILAKSSISFFGFLCGAFAAISIHKKNWRLSFGMFLFFALTIWSFHFLKPELFTHISRYDAWPMFYKSVNEKANLLIGGGLGSFRWFGPQAQGIEHFQEGHWWLWAHNDWLQIILEIGWIGFALSLLTYTWLLFRSANRPYLFGGVVAFGVTMVGNYNLHVASIGLLAWWICCEVAFEK